MAQEVDLTLEIVEEVAFEIEVDQEQSIEIELKETGPRGAGVPAGGTEGQVLTKDSDADDDTKWATPSSGGGVDDLPYTLINLSDKIQGKLDLAGPPEPFDPEIGTVECLMYFNRVGRTVDGIMSIAISADAAWPDPDPFIPINALNIRAEDLPYLPRIYPQSPVTGIPPVGVGAFSLINITEPPVGEDPPVEAGQAIGSVITDFGGSLQQAILTFFNATTPTTGGITNLVFDGNPYILIGNNVIVYSRFIYEAAHELGYMNITGTLGTAGEGEAYSQELFVTVSSPFQLDLTAEVVDGVLPDGLELSISGKTITISGTPTEFGAFPFSIKLTGDNGDEHTQEFTLNVDEYQPPSGISITEDFESPATQDEAYSSMVNIILESEGEQLPVSFEVISGALPGGTSLALANDTELTLSGTPTADGTFTFTVEITDTNGATGEKEFTIVVDPSNPENDPLYLGTVSGSSYNIQFQNGDPGQNILSYVAGPGEILKIRTSNMVHDFGEGVIVVLIGEFMIFTGGYWRKYEY